MLEASGNRTVNTYAYLFRCASQSLALAKSQEKGQFYNVMSCLVFCAFSLEAFSNHIGRLVFRYWDEIESIKIHDKLKIIHGQLKLPYDSSARPIQTIIELIKFRNLMAHGDTEAISIKKTITETELDSAHRSAQTKWEKYCTVENAERALEDTCGLMKQLHLAAGSHEAEFLLLAHSTVGTTSVAS